MYRAPCKQYLPPDSDFEQAIQAYDQGYEYRRQGKSFNNPWKTSPVQYTDLGNQVTWEDDLNRWFANGYFDWRPGDWVPYLTDEQQDDHAINPKTNKTRTRMSNTVVDLNAILK